jgi:ABC-type nitrate/sulfonate/bicarbonate transport system substrate-binding protein
MKINLLALRAIGLCAVLAPIAQRQGLFSKRGIDLQIVAVSGTDIPELTIDNPIGHIGAPAALMRAAAGADLRILACFDSARLSSCLVVHPSICAAEQLRGKRLGARASAAALWLHTVIALERLGLDPEQDRIRIAEIGEPADIVAALETGRIQGAVLPRPYCAQLVRQGFSILLDLSLEPAYGAPDALVARADFLQEHPKASAAIVAALIESAAFTLSPFNKSVVLRHVSDALSLSGPDAELALSELVKCIVRKPYPSAGHLHRLQLAMAKATQAVLAATLENLLTDHIVRQLDRDGLIDRTYAAYAAT